MPDTAELRAQIETIDEEIIDLIATRMEISDELAKAKKKAGVGYWDDENQADRRGHPAYLQGETEALLRVT